MARAYHPDDCPEEFLESADVKRAVASMIEEAGNDADRAALELIAAHERIHRDVVGGRIDAKKATGEVDALAKEYLKRFGDWVHNRSKLYWAFYRRLPELGVVAKKVRRGG